MDHIHNGNLQRHKKNDSWGTNVSFPWTAMERKLFEQSNLGRGRRYQALTLRYGYKIVKGMCESDYRVIFKISLDWCYIIAIPVC